jgi:ribonuclease BN (tRNA processing enzyme)
VSSRSSRPEGGEIDRRTYLQKRTLRDRTKSVLRTTQAIRTGLQRSVKTDHTSPEVIGKLAKAARVKSVVLSHFVPCADSDPDSVYVDGVKAHYGGPVTAAQHLQAF